LGGEVASVPRGSSTARGHCGADALTCPPLRQARGPRCLCPHAEVLAALNGLGHIGDQFSRQVVSWSMGSRIDTSLVLDALVMALWRRQPRDAVTVHSDQGCPFTGHEWQTVLRDHNLVSSMSRRGNCHDNAVAESFFQLLKRERI
jgi:Integrase core domain